MEGGCGVWFDYVVGGAGRPYLSGHRIQLRSRQGPRDHDAIHIDSERVAMNRLRIVRSLDAPVERVWAIVGKPGVSPGPGRRGVGRATREPDGSGLIRAVKVAPVRALLTQHPGRVCGFSAVGDGDVGVHRSSSRLCAPTPITLRPRVGDQPSGQSCRLPRAACRLAARGTGPRQRVTCRYRPEVARVACGRLETNREE